MSNKIHLFPRPLEISETEGFEKDILGRKRYGDGLTNLVSSVADPLVIAVDGQWGSGKSTFLKMWGGELRKAGFPVVYFDAYAHDYNSDAFLAIAGEIISLLQEKEKAETPKSKAFIDKATGVGKVLLRAGLRGGVKAATLGGLDIDDVEDVIADEASKVADQLIGKRLTEQKEEKDTLQAFRDALAELPKHLSKAAEDDAKPLVFIIDELDRCRPLFALELLEKIKHFFSVSNVHFVMGVNLEQLRNSVMLAYGANINAHSYLEKFIHLVLTLDGWQPNDKQVTSGIYIRHLVKSMELDKLDRDYIGYTNEYIERIAQAKNLSLRSVERVMSNLAIAFTFSNRGALHIPAILAGLCVLKVTDPSLYNDAKHGRLFFKSVVTALHLPTHGGEIHVRPPGSVHDEVEWWQFSTNPGASQSLIEIYAKQFTARRIDRMEIVPAIIEHILDRLTRAG